MAGCAVDGCERLRYCKGYCRLHYGRMRRTGSPTWAGPRRQDLRWVKTLDEALVAIASWIEVDGVGWNPCWLWTGSLSAPKGFGYGMSRGVKKWLGDALLHRALYRHLRGPIPDGLELDHLCRVRGCCNPWHLEAVTRSENCIRGHDARPRRIICAHGHAVVGDNLQLVRHANGRVTTRCRECDRRASRAYQARRRALASV